MSIPLDLSPSAIQAFDHDNLCTWCDGCGDYGILSAVKLALASLGKKPHEVLMCFDVGCHGNMSDKIEGYRAHGLHGRVIPFASGAKLGNPDLPVLAFGGDGASFSEGVGHLVHAIRSNYPIVFVLHNNANYGLTTGQASSLTPQSQPMNSSPNGIPEKTLPSMDFVFSLEPSFVARSHSGNIEQMTEVLIEAIKHPGFAFVDILQACPTYNKAITHKWLKDRCREVREIDGYDVGNREQARSMAIDTEDNISTGVLYQDTTQPSFLDQLVSRKERTTTPLEEVRRQDISQLQERFL